MLRTLTRSVTRDVGRTIGTAAWTPLDDAALADLWDGRDLEDGAVASWASASDPGTTVAQSTSDNRPTASSGTVAFDGSNDSLSRTRLTGTLIATYSLPDASGGDPGEGFTCTGLVRAPDGTWWCGNDGRNLDGDLTYAPSLVHMSADWSTKLGEILLAPLYPGIESVQGVAYDTSDDTLWFSDLSGNLIRHIQTDGTVLDSDDIAFTAPNGLAYDAARDMLYVGTTSGVSRVTMAGAVDAAYDAGASTWDQLWYDADLDLVYVSWGTNGSDGGLVVVDIDEDRIVAEYDLPGFDAAEGIHLDGRTLTTLNDGYFHGTPSGANAVLVYDIQPGAARVVDIFGLFSVASTTTTDSVICAGDPIGGPGWGLFAASNAQLRVFANTAAGTTERVQIDCSVATLTAMQLVYVRIDTTNEAVTIWRNGVERETTGSAAALDGILTGHAALAIGNAPDTGARQPAMSVKCLGYYMGAGDRQRTQAWMAWAFGHTDLLPSDDPYKLAPPWNA
jgi:hypothetical protein